MDYQEQTRKLIDININALQDLKGSVDGAFIDTVKAMRQHLDQGCKIVVTGVGKSYHVGNKIAATLSSTGSPAVGLHPTEALHGDLGVIQQGDIILAMSYSGESEELLRMLPFAREREALVVSITGNPASRLGRLSDHVVLARVDEEACPFNLAPTTSALVSLAIGDILAALLHQMRDFTVEEYARLHPAGSIGNTVNLKVKDIMRTGERVARVHQDDQMKAAVVSMTKAQAGAVAVVDDQNTVVGIVTDGDIRRHMDEINIASLAVSDVMTGSPISVQAEDSALEVYHQFENRDIDDLIVTDPQGVLLGMVDIQDMPKLKVF